MGKFVESLDHAKYAKRVRTMSVESLRFTIKDCQEAIKANPEASKAGWYADEVCYCSMELKRRGL